MDSILIPMMTAVIDCNDEEEGNASNINSVDDEDMQMIDSDDEEEEEGNDEEEEEGNHLLYMYCNIHGGSDINQINVDNNKDDIGVKQIKIETGD